MESPGTMSCPVRSVVVPPRKPTESPAERTIPVKSVVVPEICLMSIEPTVMTPPRKVRPPAWTLPASPSIANTLEAAALSMNQVVLAISMVELAVGSPMLSKVVSTSAAVGCQARPLDAEEEAVRTRLSAPTGKSNQSVPSDTMRSPRVGVVEAMSLSSSSYAWVSVPIVNPRLPIAVLVEERSSKLLAERSSKLLAARRSPLPVPKVKKSYPVGEVVEAMRASPVAPWETTTQAEPVAAMRLPLVVLNAANTSKSASHAWVSVPMVRPKLPMAVLVEERSVKLLAASSKSWVRSVEVAVK